MSFWDIFKNESSSHSDANSPSGLYQKIKLQLPENSEKELIIVSCLAGLLSRVAYSDLEISEQEKNKIIQILEEKTHLDLETSKTIGELAFDEIKQLSGTENHKYCYPLNEYLTNDQKYSILLALFSIAASDGITEEDESEEIRLICKGLLLEHKHYISARASVVKSLSVLKK